MPAEGEVTHMACVQEASLHFSVVNFFSSEDVTGVSAVGCWVAATCPAVFRHGERRGSCPGSSQSKCDMDKTIPTQNNGLKYHLSDIRPILTSNWNTKYIYIKATGGTEWCLCSVHVCMFVILQAQKVVVLCLRKGFSFVWWGGSTCASWTKTKKIRLELSTSMVLQVWTLDNVVMN